MQLCANNNYSVSVVNEKFDGEPLSANGLWEAAPGWGVTLGYQRHSPAH